jgi:polyhydroxybutyrate depolymerase
MIMLIAFAGVARAEVMRHTIDVDGLERSYIVYQPQVGDEPRPVVLSYHGGGGSAAGHMAYSGMNDAADRFGFIVVYPEGTGPFERALHTWNVGNCCGYALRNNIDDVRFTDVLLDDLAGRYAIDANRVYATGLSNGAMMSYMLAAKLPDRIAAIAPVGAAMGFDLPDDARPMPIIHFHGDHDQNAPFNGGIGPRGVAKIAHMPVRECVAAWAKVNGCETEPAIERLPDVADDGTTVRREVYRSDRYPIELYVIEGGGHTWPGQPARIAHLRRYEPGPSTRDISANDVMWAFFERFSLADR